MLWKLTMHLHKTLHQPIFIHYYPREHPKSQKNLR
jgi:hypothetical protein